MVAVAIGLTAALAVTVLSAVVMDALAVAPPGTTPYPPTLRTTRPRDTTLRWLSLGASVAATATPLA